MRALFSILILLIASCIDERHEPTTHILDFYYFTIETPVSWKKLKVEGIDSYAGGIEIDSTDTIYFDLGLYSNDLSGYIKMQNGDSTIFTMEASGGHVIQSDSLGIDSLLQNSFKSETIDRRKARIAIPKNTGIGTTGVYMDSLWKAGKSNDKFNFYGNNLKPAVEQRFLKAIKTLKFYDKR